VTSSPGFRLHSYTSLVFGEDMLNSTSFAERTELAHELHVVGDRLARDAHDERDAVA